MSGGGKQSTTNEFATEQKPYIADIFSRAQSAFESIQPGNYTGNFFSPVDTRELLGIGQRENVIGNNQNLGESSKTGISTIADRLSSGKYLEPMNMEFQGLDDPSIVQGAINSQLNPVRENLMESILPQTASAAIEGGAYGGSRFQDLQGRALRDYSAKATDTAGKYAFEDLSERRTLGQKDLSERRSLAPALFAAEQSAASMLPELEKSVFDLELAPGKALTELGAEARRLDQIGIDEALAQYDSATSQPFRGLDTYANLIQGFGSPLNSTTKNKPGAVDWLTAIGSFFG